jgi:hypothetical protein
MGHGVLLLVQLRWSPENREERIMGNEWGVVTHLLPFEGCPRHKLTTKRANLSIHVASLE